MRRFLPFLPRVPTVAVIRLNGMIASGNRFGVLNDAGTAPMIEKAFRRGKPDAVALVVNSPGGSPAQSSLIAARIRRLADEKKVKVYAFVEDVAASGGYWLASAADEVWIDATSILGSIGVISASFGFHDLIGRYGVERRLHTAGKSKSFLDPFLPEKKDDIVRLRSIQDQLHETFIAQIKARRGGKLSEDEDLFTGAFWIGQKAVDLGLADGIGHAAPKMKEIFGDRVRFRSYGLRRGLFQRLGAQLAGDALALVEERGLYARYGL